MTEILTYLPILAVLIISNILLGTFYNVSVKEIQFDKTVLLDGIKKAVYCGRPSGAGVQRVRTFLPGHCAWWGAIHGGYAGNGRVDCTELADLQMG